MMGISDIGMTSRERVLAAISHTQPDKVPVCLAYETPEGIAQRYGKVIDPELMRQDAEGAFIDLSEPDRAIRLRYHGEIPEDARINPWGVATWRSSTRDTFAVCGPLRNMTHPNELDSFPFPHIPDDIPPSLTSRVDLLHARGLAVQGAMSQTIFELAWNMYGMERLLVAFSENRRFAHRLLDEITERKTQMAILFAKAGVDILRLGDDVGTQHGMLLSPGQWRELLKPRLATIIAAARQELPDLPVFYHSDGNITEIVEELIEIGVTILNPVQPECMDPFKIKRRYGDRLALWGTVGTQSHLPFGSPTEIRETIHKYIEVLGKNGGYVIGPTHSINRDVPWENIEAFYEAVRDYG